MIDVPRSGCTIVKKITGAAMIIAKKEYKILPCSFNGISWKNLDNAKIRDTYANSDGWILINPKSNQRFTRPSDVK